MLETAIIGGGLCGLALASSLQGQGREFALFEARTRLGGRILSVPCTTSGLALDLGPTWFWPQTQPAITHLVAGLGLADFPQHDQDTVLHLRDGDKKPERIEGKAVHSGAHRLEGGMARLTAALAETVPPERVHLAHVLTGLSDRGDHVLLSFAAGDRVSEIAARRVVLAIPPRLLAENVRFEPGLDEATQLAMREAATWMAAQAKVAIGYDRPHWRDAGLSGNAFVTHEQAVVGEIFDACDGAGTKAALAGFVALSPELRRSFADGLPMLLGSQMVQVFGAALEHGEQHYQDWAAEPYTCSRRDHDALQVEHTGFANPLLRRPLWTGKLYLGSSETATQGAGYLEGAVVAARRIERDLARSVAAAGAMRPSETTAGDGAVALNDASLARFGAWVSDQRDLAFDGYRQRLARSLATQQRDQLTQRAVLESVEEVYRSALLTLEALPFDMTTVPIERGRSALTPDVQRPFRDFMQSLLDDVVAFNRTSCALSNFPDEHHLSKEYTQTILRDIAAAWQEFSLSANRLLLAKAQTSSVRRPRGQVTGISA